MNKDQLHERALLENKVFDVIGNWKQYHPRTFWDQVDKIVDLLFSNEELLAIKEWVEFALNTNRAEGPYNKEHQEIVLPQLLKKLEEQCLAK